jgi:L,D-peptidoglycan transpeptidase YkuD (ErfK/YbiS/YcfS/YnhG family)
MERGAGLPALLLHRRLRRTLACSLALAMITVIAPLSSPIAIALQPHLAACNTVADAIPGASNSGQLITVVAPTTSSRIANLNFYVRQGGCFRLAAGPYPALDGRNGLSAEHHEGDGTTPIGLFGFQSTMYGVNADPGVTYHYRRLVCGDWWDEQSSSALYNHFVHVRCGTKPDFSGGSEALWETVPSYDYLAVIAYNRHPVVPGKGSAIFLHVSDGQPTAGCVSIPVADLLRVLRALRPDLHPLIDITARVSLRLNASVRAAHLDGHAQAR